MSDTVPTTNLPRWFVCQFIGHSWEPYTEAWEYDKYCTRCNKHYKRPPAPLVP